jgi:hypothetical protein
VAIGSVTRRTLLLPLAVVVVLALVPIDASANYWRHCGSQNQQGAGWYYVKSHNLHCRKARRVASAVSRTGRAAPGFTCYREHIGYEASRIYCRRYLGRRLQQVRFTVGA